MRLLFLCLILLVLFCPLGIDIYLPVIPLMQVAFQTSDSQIQLSLSLFVAAMGFGQLIIGPLVDRYGRRPVALLGIAAYFLASIAIVFCSNLTQLLLLRIIQGGASSCTAIVTFAVVRDSYHPSAGAKIYSYLNGALSLVPALAPVLGDLLSARWGWRSNFYFLALFSAVVFFIILCRLPETRPQTTAKKQLLHIGQYLKMLQNQQFLGYSLCAMGGMSVVLSYVFFSPHVLMVQMGLSSTEFVMLFAGNALVIMLMSFVAPHCIEQVGRRRSVEIGAVLMLLSGLLVPLLYQIDGHSVIGFILPVMIACSGFSLLLGTSASLALEPFADSAGTAAALQGCIQMLGASVVSILAAQLPFEKVFSLAVVMVVFGLLALVVGRFQHDSKLKLYS